MKLRLTSITAPEVGELTNSVAVSLEDRLRPVLETKDYGGGIEQFAAYFVSVDSDPMENERYCIANNRAGRYKSQMSGKMISFVGIAVPVDPRLVLSSSKEALPQLLAGLLLQELEAPAYAMPKKFDRKRLVADLMAALAVT